MLEAHHATDPALALQSVEPFLAAEPIKRNQILTTFDRLLHSPGSPEAQCWWVSEGDTVVAVAVLTAAWPRAILAADSSPAIRLLAEIMSTTAPDLPAVGGEASVASTFAGAWTELSGGGAEPMEGERLYELEELTTPDGTPGSARRATVDDVATLAAWHLGFCADVGVAPWPNPLETMAARVAERGVWVWEHNGLAAMASATRAIAGASRIAHVYSPASKRGRGSGAAVTAAATSARLSEGAEQCLLYTQLTSATPNHIYRSLGFRAIEERLVYRLIARP